MLHLHLFNREEPGLVVLHLTDRRTYLCPEVLFGETRHLSLSTCVGTYASSLTLSS